MYYLNDFVYDLEKLIALVEKEALKRKNGIKGEGTCEQLTQYILPELAKLLVKAKANKLPPDGFRCVSCNECIRGKWAFEWRKSHSHTIRNAINSLDSKYKYFLKVS